MQKAYIFFDEGTVNVDGRTHFIDMKKLDVKPEWEAMHWWFDKDKGMIEHHSNPDPDAKPWEKGDENEWFKDYKIVEPFIKAWQEVSLSPDMYDPSVQGTINKLYVELSNLEVRIAERKAEGLPVDQDEYRRDHILAEMKVENAAEAQKLHHRIVKDPR